HHHHGELRVGGGEEADEGGDAARHLPVDRLLGGPRLARHLAAPAGDAGVDAVAGEITWRVVGTTAVVVPVLGSMMESTAWGCTHTPPLATAFTAASISTGVTTTLWPKDISL